MKRFSEVFTFSDSESDQEEPSQEAMRKFETQRSMQLHFKRFKLLGKIAEGNADETEIEKQRQQGHSSEMEIDEELETSDAVKVALDQLKAEASTTQSKFNDYRSDYKKSDYNEYSDSNLSVEIRSTCSTLFDYRKGEHCDECGHINTSCGRCMKAYRKQKEGRTRKNYIYGGRNPMIRDASNFSGSE